MKIHQVPVVKSENMAKKSGKYQQNREKSENFHTVSIDTAFTPEYPNYIKEFKLSPR